MQSGDAKTLLEAIKKGGVDPIQIEFQIRTFLAGKFAQTILPLQNKETEQLVADLWQEITGRPLIVQPGVND